MSDSGKRQFIEAYERRVATRVRHPVTNESMTYRRVFEIQTRFLARCFRDRNADYVPFRVQ